MQQEIDKNDYEDFIGVSFDHEQEIYESDEEYYSESEVGERKMPKYDLDTMYDIIQRRDFNKWSLSTITHRYKQLSKNETTTRKQISR